MNHLIWLCLSWQLQFPCKTKIINRMCKGESEFSISNFQVTKMSLLQMNSKVQTGQIFWSWMLRWGVVKENCNPTTLPETSAKSISQKDEAIFARKVNFGDVGHIFRNTKRSLAKMGELFTRNAPLINMKIYPFLEGSTLKRSILTNKIPFMNLSLFLTP